MYAIIKSGSKQFRVKEGDLIDVELLGDSGEVTFKDVVLFSNGNSIKVGSPMLSGVTVTGEIVGEFKEKKLLIYKYKKRKNCRVRNGHRQRVSRVRIKSILGGV
ncbi:MAG: 50S ribosomal protein L21 [Verrucomicrobia bacterium]|jgi:large subunit ribosomal protein L21|nr:50S ribosomal protein L21 [Verrucomicrobiota bacterium]